MEGGRDAMPQWSLHPPVVEGREWDRDKEGRLGWGVQALPFFHFKHWPLNMHHGEDEYEYEYEYL